MTHHRGAITVCTFFALSGCSAQLQGLHDDPVELPPLPAAGGPPVALLVCRFADQRGDRYSRISAADFIPGVNLFYTGRTLYHVDRGGFDGGMRGGKAQVVLGALETTLPDLLAGSIREARPAWPIEVTASPERCRSGGDAKYVIDGSIRRSEVSVHSNFLPLGLLSPLGAPTGFVDFNGEFDVEVRHAATGEVAWKHTFSVDERRAVGLYYNRNPARTMFTALLVDTVRQTSAGAIHVAERGA